MSKREWERSCARVRGFDVDLDHEAIVRPGTAIKAWRQRGGVKVPAVECLAPGARVSVRDFLALLEEMGVDTGEVEA